MHIYNNTRATQLQGNLKERKLNKCVMCMYTTFAHVKFILMNILLSIISPQCKTHVSILRKLDDVAIMRVI